MNETNLIIEEDYMENVNIYMDDIQKDKPSLLLHSCCGPCSTAVIERLAGEYNITVYFYNPNITDQEEYIKRRDSQIIVIEEFNNHSTDKVAYKEGPYNSDDFIKIAEPYGDLPEGGKRCTECFILRLEQTAITASMEGFHAFATTLTISPHKDFELIGGIGNQLGIKYRVNFLNENFKKKAGFQRSIELSKKYKLYRQNYCGCKYSVWEK